MNTPYDEDPVPFNLFACLVCAVEVAEGREPVLTENWIKNAKLAIRDHERKVGKAEDDLLYPEPK